MIGEKLTQDLSEIAQAEKRELGITDESGKVIESVFEKLKEERFEYLLKGIYANFTYSHQNFAAGLGSYSSYRGMDSQRYEDYARVLLGKNAFLLF